MRTFIIDGITVVTAKPEVTFFSNAPRVIGFKFEKDGAWYGEAIELRGEWYKHPEAIRQVFEKAKALSK